jgi:hypothetical protein
MGDVCDAAFNSTPCKASGVGYISTSRSFSFGVEYFKGAPSVNGSLSYIDKATPAKNFKSTKVTGLACYGVKQATLVGTGTVNSTTPVTFRLDIGDNGTGRTDTFKITWSSPSYTASGTLTSGDLIVTPK